MNFPNELKSCSNMPMNEPVCARELTPLESIMGAITQSVHENSNAISLLEGIVRKPYPVSCEGKGSTNNDVTLYEKLYTLAGIIVDNNKALYDLCDILKNEIGEFKII